MLYTNLTFPTLPLQQEKKLTKRISSFFNIKQKNHASAQKFLTITSQNTEKNFSH